MASQPFAVTELQLRRVEEASHVFGHCGQQAFRCETSKSLSHGHWAVAAVFLNAVSEARAIQETMGPGMWPSAMMPTTEWRAGSLQHTRFHNVTHLRVISPQLKSCS